MIGEIKKKYEVISKLTLEAWIDITRVKDKFHFYLFQHAYSIDEISYKEVDDAVFHAINKLDVLNQVLIRFKMPAIGSEIDKMYKQGYCKLPPVIQNVSKLKNFTETTLSKYSKNSFEGYDDLQKKILDNIAL